MTTSDVQLDNKRYELMAIIDPDIGEDGVKKRLDKLRKLITSGKGEIFNEELWGMRDMTYPMKKRTKGYYAVLDFAGEPESLKEMDRVLRLEPEVLRHLVTVLPPTYVPKDYTIVEEEVKEEGKEDDKKPRKKKMEESAPMKEPKVEKAPKAETKAAEEEPKKAEPAKKKEQTLEDVDAKLKSIIDNPDINF